MTLVEARPSAVLSRALRYAHAHPGLFGRGSAPVALVIPVSRLVAGGSSAASLEERLVGISRLIEGAGFALDPVLMGDSPLVPVHFRPERLSRSALVVVPGDSGLSPADWAQLAEGAGDTPVLVIGDGTSSPDSVEPRPRHLEFRSVGRPGDLARLAAGGRSELVRQWRRRFDQEEEELIDNARRADGAVGGGNLPARVIAIPAWSPESGQTVRHLIDVGAVSGAGALDLSSSLRMEVPINAAENFDRCSAVLHLPAEERAVEGSCTTRLGSPSTWVSFERQRSLPGWSILEIGLSADTHPAKYGKEPIRIQAETGLWAAPTVAFSVPFLDDRQVFSLSLPEFLRLEDPPSGFEGDIDRWSDHVDVEPGGRMATFTAESPLARFVARVSTGMNDVRLRITIENRSDEPLRGVEALLCASSRGASPFPESGHANTSIWTTSGLETLDSLPVDAGDPLYLYRSDLSVPAIAMASVDGSWVLASAFDGSIVEGGNGSSNGVCLHSRPRFGDLAPGASSTRDGLLFLGHGGDLDVPKGWHPAPRGAIELLPKGRAPCPPVQRGVK